MKIHGMSNSPAYKSWQEMKTRCYNKNRHKYRRYGARGIKVCDRWLNSFQNFYDDMGERPDGKTLDRINNDGNYEPSNCRWATPLEQAQTAPDKRVPFGRKISLIEREKILGMLRSGDTTVSAIAREYKVSRASIHYLRSAYA